MGDRSYGLARPWGGFLVWAYATLPAPSVVTVLVVLAVLEYGVRLGYRIRIVAPSVDGGPASGAVTATALTEHPGENFTDVR